MPGSGIFTHKVKKILINVIQNILNARLDEYEFFLTTYCCSVLGKIFIIKVTVFSSKNLPAFFMFFFLHYFCIFTYLVVMYLEYQPIYSFCVVVMVSSMVCHVLNALSHRSIVSGLEFSAGHFVSGSVIKNRSNNT